jgi:hypothetical protein
MRKSCHTIIELLRRWPCPDMVLRSCRRVKAPKTGSSLHYGQAPVNRQEFATYCKKCSLRRTITTVAPVCRASDGVQRITVLTS